MGPIRDEEIPYLAALHLGVETPDQVNSCIRRGGGRFHFYLDKVTFYAREERQGFLIARQQGLPAGFIICTASQRRLRRRSIRGGYWLQWALKGALGWYGFRPALLKQLARIPLTFFGLCRGSRSGTHGGNGKGPAPSQKPADAHIYSVVTLPSFRRQGIASGLIAACESYLRHCGKGRVSIAVLKENFPARRTYEKAGYRMVGETVESLGVAFQMEKAISTGVGKRRIAHIITRMIPGGAQRIVRRLVESSAAAGYEVFLLTGRDSGDRQVIEELRSNPLIRLEIVPSLVRNPHPLRDYRTARVLRRWMEEHTPDVVHTHTSKAGFLGRWAARRAGIGRIVHSSHGHPFSIHGSLAGTFYAILERRAATWSDAISVLSQDEKEEYLRRGVGRVTQYEVIGNGLPRGAFQVDPDRALANREKVTRDPRTLIAGTLCRLSFEKGLPDLLEAYSLAAKKIGNLELLLVGDGPLRREIKTRARKLGIEGKVHLVGYQDRPAEWIAAMDIFVLASTYEGFGVAALEAMAAGLPGIATRVGGLKELIDDGRDGILVPAGNPRALAEAMERLISSESLRRELGMAARETARQWTEERMMESYLELYGPNSPREDPSLPGQERPGKPDRME